MSLRRHLSHSASILAIASLTSGFQSGGPCTRLPDIPYYAGASCTVPFVPVSCPNLVSSTQCLDVFLPTSVLPSSPTILVVHGGGWSQLDKYTGQVATFVDRLCSWGYRVVSCNYTLACDNPATPGFDYVSYPQAIIDVRAAIGWIRTAGVSSYGLSDCIVIAGASAGGHLAAMAGALNGSTAAFVPTPYATTNLGVNLTIAFSADFDLFRRGCEGGTCTCTLPCQIVCNHAPAYLNDVITEPFLGHGWLDGSYAPVSCPSLPWNYANVPHGVMTGDPFFDASPTTWVHAHSSPFFIVHTQCDDYFPQEEPFWMQEMTNKFSVPTKIDTSHSCGHAFRPYTPAGSADLVHQVIQTPGFYSHCP